MTYFLLAALTLITLVPGWVWLRHRRRDLFEPIYAATAFFQLIFILRAIYDLTLGGTYLGLPPWDEGTLGAFNLAILYLILSFGAFLLGYYLPIGGAAIRSLKPLPALWDTRKFWFSVPLAVMVGGISYGLLILYLGGPAQYLGNKATIVTVDGQGYLALGVSVIPIIFGVAVTRLVSTGLGRVVTLGLLLPLILFIGLSSDSKQQFLVPVLIIIIAVHYLRRRIRFTLILPFVLFVILAFPVFNAYRGVRELSDVPSTVTQVNITDFEFLTRSVMGRFYGIDALTYAVRDTPGVMDFQYGATLEPLIVAPVPRQVWSDKPTVSFARTFANTYFGKFFFGSGIFAAPSILGEGYINFALPGMLLVGLLSGLILRSAYGYFIVRGGGAPAVFAYSIIFVHLFKFWEADLAGLIVAATTSLLLALIAIALIGSRVASPEKVAAPLNRRASLGAG